MTNIALAKITDSNEPPIYSFSRILDAFDLNTPETWPTLVQTLAGFREIHGVPWLELLPRLCAHGLIQTAVGTLLTLQDGAIPSVIEGVIGKVSRRTSAASGWEIVFATILSQGVIPAISWGPIMYWRQRDRDVLMSGTSDLLTVEVRQPKKMDAGREGGLRPVGTIIERRPLPASDPVLKENGLHKVGS